MRNTPAVLKFGFAINQKAQTDAAIFLKTRFDNVLVLCLVLPASDIDHNGGLGLVICTPRNCFQHLHPSQINAEHSHLLTSYL